MADYYLDINGLSKHLNTPKEYNERNIGAGITREGNNNGLINSQSIGGYKNSFGNQSYYATGGLAKRFGTGDYYIDAGGMIGLASGYKQAIKPIAGLVISAGKKNLAKFKAIYTPETKQNPGIIMMNMGIPFK